MKIDQIKTVAIFSHFTHKATKRGAAAPHNLRNYFLAHGKTVLYLEHPFPHSNFPYSQLIIYQPGQKPIVKTSFKLNGPQLLIYLAQLLISWYFLITAKKSIELGIALDDLGVVVFWPFKVVRRLKTLIYYALDYTPSRFTNPFTNWLYHSLDRLSSNIADVNWVAARNLINAKHQNHLKTNKPFQIVPIGYDQNQFKLSQKVRRDRLAFVGTLYHKQGLQLVLEAMPTLIKSHPQLQLTVIGAGDYEKELKNLTTKLKINHHVKYLGFIDDHLTIVNHLTKSGIGLAPYLPIPGSFTYFADPSKIKLYLMAGLPIITTDVPRIARQLVQKQAGIIVKYQITDLIKAINRLIDQPKLYDKYRHHAIDFGSRFDINYILDKAIRAIP